MPSSICFDGNGNQTRRTNGLYQATNYTYDNSDNLTGVSYPSGTPTSFTYDYDGRQLTMVDSTGTSSWTYDNADNITQLVTPQGTMQYVHDAWNRRLSLTEGTAVTNYGYTNEKLTSIAKSIDGIATTLSYDTYGRLITKNDGATKTEYGYDSNDRVNDIVHKNASTNAVLHQEHYYFSPTNNLTSKVVNSTATSYSYDSIGQLLNESNSSFINSYTYDANGNRATKTANGLAETYTYDDADKLTYRSSSSGSYTYSYDNAGRTYQIAGPGGTRTFTWDYEDRLTNLNGGGVINTNYGYNGAGTRTSKSNSGGSRTYKRDGIGVTSPVLSDGVATMVPGISEKAGGVISTIHADRLGSMKGLSSSATLTDTADYDAFGKVIARTGSSTTQKGFASGYGYLEDGESGYKLVGHRYYDADSGRFLSRDPAFDGRNWYTYCANDPINYSDPTGLSVVNAVAGAYSDYTAGLIQGIKESITELPAAASALGSAWIRGDLHDPTYVIPMIWDAGKSFAGDWAGQFDWINHRHRGRSQGHMFVNALLILAGEGVGQAAGAALKAIKGPQISTFAAASADGLGEGSTVIIGETMERVNDIARAWGPDAITFNEPWTNFDDMMMKNSKWAREVFPKAKRVIDLGLDPLRPASKRSPFYEMERGIMEEYHPY